jgi:hypothetical protein
VPGFIIKTNLDAEAAITAASEAAQRLDFMVREAGDWELNVRKGNLALSIFVGAFVAYCDFRIFVEQRRNDSIKITLERNTPWWTGLIGVQRVKNRAKEIEEFLLDQGGEVSRPKEF